MNQVGLMGRLVRDPELKYTAAGKAYANFTIAVDPPFKTANGGKADAYFIPCVAWDKRAESIAQFFTKGKPIVVSGALTTQKYVDKDGQKRTSWEVNCQNFSFVLTDKTQNGGANGGASPDDSLKTQSGDFDPFEEDPPKKASAPAEEIDPEDLYR